MSVMLSLLANSFLASKVNKEELRIAAVLVVVHFFESHSLGPSSPVRSVLAPMRNIDVIVCFCLLEIMLSFRIYGCPYTFKPL